MKLITAIIRPEQLDDVRSSLESYGVQGLTVSSAHGYGRERGHADIYRGAEDAVDLDAKIRIEVLATDEVAWDLMDIIVGSSNTGSPGDGKVWMVAVLEVMRVRTGERGTAAI